MARSESSGEGSPSVSTRKPVVRPAGRISGARQFIRECWAELNKVQWPNRQQLWQASLVVIIVCIVIGFYIFGLDQGLSRVSSWLIKQYTHKH
jgi:preprotein translocase subunit SecE